jgi:hypothetical protein
VREKLFTTRWLVTLGALGCAMTVLSVPAQGYTVGPPSPALICAGAVVANEAVLEARLGPSEGASVQAGTSVTFSGYSGAPVTFAVASSAALLSSPDIDSGLGSAQPENLFTFMSTKATAAAGTVYWDASFSTATLKGCEGVTPGTYTTKARTITVLPLPSPPPTPVIPAATVTPPPPATGSVSLEGSTVIVESGGEALLKLACTGTGTGTDTCGGKLTLTAKGTAKKGKKVKTETIGTASFSVLRGTTATIKLKLNAAGRALLNADHGRLSASLTLLKSSPAPSQTQTEKVHLVQQSQHGKTKK